MVDNLKNANSSEAVKIKTHHARIVVDGTADKPYYSIEWFDPIKKEYYLGYSSYCIGTVFNWLSECFEIVEANTTNADRIRAMSDKELAVFMFSMVDCVSCQNKLMNNGKLVFGADRKTCTDKDYYAMCDGDGRKCESVCFEWLQQPAKEDENE